MTGPVVRPTVENTLGDLHKRIRILEAVNTSSAAADYWPMVTKYTMYGWEFDKYLWLGDYYQGGWSFVSDATAQPMGGGYAYYDGTTPVNSYDGGMAIPFPLGPKGSGWRVGIWFWVGPDAGKMRVQWGTTDVSEFAVNGFGTSTSIASPSEYPGTDINWYRTNYTDTIDCYKAAVPGWTFTSSSGTIASNWAPIVIDGADGDMLTADGSGVAVTGWNGNVAMNGGGDRTVMWWLRLLTDGKNASSSSAQVKVGGIQVFRNNAFNAFMA